MTRRSFITATAGAAAALEAADRPRPNIVFFMTDDHGAWALGSACREMHTPNIDRLAAEGIRFTNAFACTPVCSPSRATFYTGKLPSHHGVQDFLLAEDSFGPASRRFLEGHTSFADVLKENGYHCGLIGKWHLGHDDEPQSGFDTWCVAPRGSGPYRDVTFYDNGEKVENTGYKTDFIGERAVRFLDERYEDPFCLVIPFFAPHDPFDYQPEKYRKYYENSDFSCFPELPPHPQGRAVHRKHLGNRESKIGFSALVSGIDANVGRVVDKLEALGLRDDTVVVFTADQGYNCGHHGFWGKGNGTFPFNVYEESIRTPLIWTHPGHIEPGREESAMVSSLDFFPTLLDYVGVRDPGDPERVGRSYAAFLRDQAPPEWPTEQFFEFGYVRAIRTKNLKYVERGDGWPDELFDLEADPDERINRIGAPRYREQALSLRSRLHAFFEAADAPPIDEWRSTTKQKLPTDGGYYTWE